MEKKILLVVDDSKSSKNAIQYVVNMSSWITELSCVLFHVQPHISQFLLDEAKADIKSQMALEKLKEKNAKAAMSFLEKYKADMVGMGIPEERIQIKTQARKIGLAKDIIELAQEKRYDAIVLGRRGLSRLEEIFSESLTRKLADHSQVVPVWIIDGKVSSKRVLAAVDGSEGSLKAIDYAAFMFRNSPLSKLTLLHVKPKLRDYCEIDFHTKDDDDLESLVAEGNKRCLDRFMAVVTQKFSEAGISKDQVEIKEIESLLNVGDVIVEQAQKGGYGTVVVGRRGADRSFFMGSISNYVIQKMEKCAIWLVP
jgi:nucleotide-binding universal stress UspA family protein